MRAASARKLAGAVAQRAPHVTVPQWLPYATVP
jgi:hypothetical protein